MGLTDPESIAGYVKAVEFPINVMIRKGLPSIAELQRLGVARVSFGPSASYATMGLLRRASPELLDRGTSATLLHGAISYAKLNRPASPRRGACGREDVALRRPR